MQPVSEQVQVQVLVLVLVPVPVPGRVQAMVRHSQP